jgi:DNA invertase Pin-like site-specific DNA recombinase
VEGVLAAFAQFDNDVRSDRTRTGMRAALALGRWVFLAPFGYINAPRTRQCSTHPHTKAPRLGKKGTPDSTRVLGFDETPARRAVAELM